ncbi:uncharacterized protein B0H18DRAFT_872201 [Fomitopsis serialis]|uniref:uncharacterized protein n=1 Tax=Fomitopsis serialis TaxID=139415 RepID=UPI0020077CAD|nr:uncharacterized protein B0H18DRAFT_872201 [Neoantrodia serialis]KAH9931467.1 hypothetical protein B0H18DRAFT_872201 [Neoantrodia serialis]
MHLAALNLTDLMLGLWRGTLDCDKDDDRQTWDWAVLQGDLWTTHGSLVADMRPFLPGSFDRPPRNPAEKISSGYKAQEFLTYVFGLGPALLLGTLPDEYWVHFCKLVRGLRLINQRSISEDDLTLASQLFREFIEEFEALYYQYDKHRLHFCRQSIHLLRHICEEIIRLGPLICYTQWTMERTIGNLVEEIRQPSNPYANLAVRGLRRCQINALKALDPVNFDLDKSKKGPPQGAEELGDGYTLLRARDRSFHVLTPAETTVIRSFVATARGENMDHWDPHYRRWARLRLPNGQIARSAYKETLKAPKDVRQSRNVKICVGDQTILAEVQYFFRVQVLRDDDEPRALALVKKYSNPNRHILERSSGAVWACTAAEDGDWTVVEAKSIRSVVAMCPMPPAALAQANMATGVFLVEKLGLDVMYMDGTTDGTGEDDEDEGGDRHDEQDGQ